MWKTALFWVSCVRASLGQVAEQFSWNTDPFGDCCSSTLQRYRAVYCSNIFTGAIVNASLCDPDRRPCESRPCSCSSIRCTADSTTCFEGVATGSCAASAVTSSFVGCLPEASLPAASSSIRNLECMNCTGTEPCLDGLPLYRNMSVHSGDECVSFCVEKGLDIAGFVKERGECRCTASVLDMVYELSPERRLAGCLRFPEERLTSFAAQACDIAVYRYGGPLEAGNVPHALVGVLDQDVRYMNSVVQGVMFKDGDEPEERRPLAAALGMRDGTPGWERNCWPSNCGPGAGPWSVRVSAAPDQDSAPFEEYVLLRYAFEANVDNSRKEVFREAADRWRRKTCINLVEQGSADDPSSTDAIVGIYDLDSCYVSGLGNQKYYSDFDVSWVNLGWCDSMIYVGSVIHEIGHVLGMNHEQKRPDGAGEYFGHGPYLQMIWENVESDWVDQWTQEEETYTGSADDGSGDPHVGYAPYDYASIMHYTVTDQAIVPEGTITGLRQSLSDGDVRQILDMYQCKGGSAPPGPSPTPPPTAPPTGDCKDTNDGAADPWGDGCAEYVGNEHWCGNYDTPSFDSLIMCCACGGGQHVCLDTDNGEVDSWGDSCADYVGYEYWCGNYDTPTFDSLSMCCACRGVAQTPTQMPSSAPTPIDRPAACPWLEGPTAVDDTLECSDGIVCTGWSCCAGHGDRAKCPPNLPLMCEAAFCGDGTQHCCSTDCSDLGGERSCPTESSSSAAALPTGHLRR